VLSGFLSRLQQHSQPFARTLVARRRLPRQAAGEDWGHGLGGRGIAVFVQLGKHDRSGGGVVQEVCSLVALRFDELVPYGRWTKFLSPAPSATSPVTSVMEACPGEGARPGGADARATEQMVHTQAGADPTGLMLG
jgi:hypothetical protein